MLKEMDNAEYNNVLCARHWCGSIARTIIWRWWQLLHIRILIVPATVRSHDNDCEKFFQKVRKGTFCTILVNESVNGCNGNIMSSFTPASLICRRFWYILSRTTQGQRRSSFGWTCTFWDFPCGAIIVKVVARYCRIYARSQVEILTGYWDKTQMYILDKNLISIMYWNEFIGMNL